MANCLTNRRILPLLYILHDGTLKQESPADAKADICEG